MCSESLRCVAAVFAVKSKEETLAREKLDIMNDRYLKELFHLEDYIWTPPDSCYSESVKDMFATFDEEFGMGKVATMN